MTLPYASVHGRFQPLHIGHMEYIKAALDRSEFLYIGITQFRRRQLTQTENVAALHRGQPESNPLTYFERAEILKAVLDDNSRFRGRYSVLPFPIEEPRELPDFLPTSIPILTTTYDEWNAEKITTLESVGYQVENLWTRDEKEVVGSEIRMMMARRDESWTDLVPPNAAALLRELDIPQRLRALSRITSDLA